MSHIYFVNIKEDIYSDLGSEQVLTRQYLVYNLYIGDTQNVNKQVLMSIDIDIETNESRKCSHMLRLSLMHITVLSAKAVCCIWLLTPQTNFSIQSNSVDNYHIDLVSETF